MLLTSSRWEQDILVLDQPDDLQVKTSALTGGGLDLTPPLVFPVTLTLLNTTPHHNSCVGFSWRTCTAYSALLKHILK